MRYIIDIPEEIVTDIKDYCGMSIADAKEVLPIILNAIHNGTPFPNGHGDLIDRNELLSHMKCTYRYDCPGSSCDKCSDNCVEVWDIENAKPVIQADNEGET